MKESFLHYIWQLQKFNKAALETRDGATVEIYKTGDHNTNAGPDFLNAKLNIDGVIWYGHLEIHIKSSDWNLHGHQHDEAYNNVVAHVVWIYDQEVHLENGQIPPTIELQGRVDPDLILKCNSLINNPVEIPCGEQLGQTAPIEIHSMIDLVGIGRLKSKSERILEWLEKNKGHWETTTYQLLAGNFGFNKNETQFIRLAKSLDHKIFLRHANHQLASEALVFGIAGFLEQVNDYYQLQLKNEFEFLSKKYGMESAQMSRAEWKFLRLRPGNFPTVRLAQFAAFLRVSAKNFQKFIHFENKSELIEMFNFRVSSYWLRHYDFAKSGLARVRMGSTSVDLILINTVAPLLAAYAKYSGEHSYMEKAVNLLQQLKSEKNHILSTWAAHQVNAKNAFEGQGLISLRNEYCLKKKCLSCKIGVSLLNKL